MTLVPRLGIALLLLGFALTADAQSSRERLSTEERLDALLASWKDKKLDELLEVWGEEKNVEYRNGNRVYVYEDRVKARISPFGISVSPGAGTLRCAVRFEIAGSDSIVVRATRRGNAPDCWDAYKRNTP